MPKQIPNILCQGAEAIILHEGSSVIKDRISKSYRHPALDKKIIKARTKSEAKILEKAAALGISPKPTEVESNKIIMPFIEGKKLSEHLEQLDWKSVCKTIGSQIARLHDANIIHGDLTTSNMILAENKNENLIKLLGELRKLKLPEEEFAIFGSVPMGIRGLRDCKDLDIIVRPKLWEKLAKKYIVIDEKKIKVGPIEIFKNWLPWFDNVEELIDDAELFEGLRVVKLERVLAWKKIFAREKDKEDVKIIENYQNSLEKTKNPNSKLYFIDFGLSFISHRIEDKAVDLHLIKQALEAKHFTIHKEAEKIILDNYNSKERAKILAQLKKVEARGRYKKGS